MDFALSFCETEFLVYQILFSESTDESDDVDVNQLKDEVRERGQLLDALSDPRMMSLFVLFDKDGDSAVSFKEVACGLYHLTKSMEESAKATTGLLLMMDKDDKRVLVYEQFAKLILAIAAAAHTTFDEVADDLTLAMTEEGADEMDPAVLKALTIADEEYRQARDAERAEKEQRKVMDALSYGRTIRLFDLWDADKRCAKCADGSFRHAWCVLLLSHLPPFSLAAHLILKNCLRVSENTKPQPIQMRTRRKWKKLRMH